MGAYLHGNFSNVRMYIDSWTSGMASHSDHTMSYSTGAQPPSIGDVRKIVVSETSGGSQMYSDGQPPSVNDVGRREPSQREPSCTRYDYPADSGEFDSSKLGSGGGGGGDEPARTLEGPRDLVWTPQLHKQFVEAVAHLGIGKAIPETIMQLMSVDGLTWENVLTHLQKYKVYLSWMQALYFGGISIGGSFGWSGNPATDHLFATSSLPPDILNQFHSHPDSNNFSPYMPVAAFRQHHQPQQMAAFAGHHQDVGHFGASANHQFFSIDDMEFAKELRTLNLFPIWDD